MACTSGSTSAYSSSSGGGGSGDADADADPLLDLNAGEELDLPFLTVGTVGKGDSVGVLVMESRVQVGMVEGMLAVGVDGCKQVREILDEVVRRQGRRVLEDGRG